VLDLKLIRERPDEVRDRLAARGGNAGALIADLLRRDEARRAAVRAAEDLKAERNRVSEQIGQARRRGEDASAEQARMREVGDRIKQLDAELRTIEADIETALLGLPNLPHVSVPVGPGADENVEVRRWGTPRVFDFEPKAHEVLGEQLGLLDAERAVKIAKSRFTVLWGAAARMERALAQFMLDLHTREHGFTEVWVPHLVSGETMLGTGQLPKFEDQAFKTQEPDENRTLYLIPTAEVPVTALHRGEFLPAASLPRRYVAFTPCYRREAGTHGQDTKGMIRQHQFDKVEMVKITAPEQSYDELESMVASAEAVLQRLGLPYRVVVLSTGDMSPNSAKTYDLEVWLPGQGKYREISSCSNCEAYQARRLDLRYRPAGGGRAEHCHTLNGSGLAVGRTLIAVLENYQNADGTVTVPEALRSYMGGLERLGPTT
jgi:seryl-tRNA synthetase